MTTARMMITPDEEVNEKIDQETPETTEEETEKKRQQRQQERVPAVEVGASVVGGVEAPVEHVEEVEEKDMKERKESLRETDVITIVGMNCLHFVIRGI